MRKSFIHLALTFTLLLSSYGQALALEVGKARVRSYLNEPLVVTIPAQVANIQERNSLAATLAPATEYVARGLQPLADPDDLVVQVVEGGNLEEMLIEVRSLSNINEPFLGLVLQLAWDGGNQVQEFTLLLDPRPGTMADEPEVQDAPSVGLAPAEPQAQTAPARTSSKDDPKLQQLGRDMSGSGVTISQGEPQVIIRKVSPDDYLAGKRGTAGSGTAGDSFAPATTAHKAAPSFTGDTYGPVASGETLWNIATQVRPSNSISMAQVMDAIFKANPSAFDGSYQTLKKGAMLKIPSEAQMRASDARAGSSAASTQTETVGSDQAVSESVEGGTLDRPDIWNAPEQAPADPAELERKGGLVTKSAEPPVLESEASAESDAAETETAAETGQTVPAEGLEAESDDTTQDPGKVDYAALDAGTDTASAESATGEMPAADDQVSDAAPESEVTETEAEETTSAPVAEISSEETDSGMADSGQTLKLAGVILAVILLTYLWFRRRRAAEEFETAAYAMPLTEEPEDLDAVSDGVAVSEPADVEPPRISTEADVIDDMEETDVAESDAILEQADTYLSYGLYESAAETLEKGLEAEPGRADLRMKLLETHETASNNEQFVEAVQDWQASNTPPNQEQRSQVEAMAQRVAPGVDVFSAGAAAVAVSDQVTDEQDSEFSASPSEDKQEVEEDLPLPDFDLDTPEDTSASEELSVTESPLDTGGEAESVALDLDLDLDSEPDAGVAEPGVAGEASEELDLPDLDLDLPDTQTESLADKPVAPAEADPGSLDFSLELEEEAGADESEAELPKVETASEEPAAELSLEEPEQEGQSEIQDEAEGIAEETPEAMDESEYDVKLDLAQAYIDMGEPDLAKGLLDEVLEGGNDSQRATAEKLTNDLDAS